MNNENFLIETEDLELARNICKEILDSDIRNRAVANALAADIAKKYFTGADIDTTSGIHNIAQVLKDVDIADIYINGAYIDVRLYFNDNELCIPQKTFDLGIFPIAYMFIKVGEELSGASVTGFVTPSSIDTSCSHNGYYKVNESDLISFYDIEPLLVTNYDEGLPENFEEQMFNYLDGVLQDTREFYQSLLNSEECRICLKNAAYTQNVFNFISAADNSTEKTSPIQETSTEENSLSDSYSDADFLASVDDNSLELSVDNMLDSTEDVSMDLLESADNDSLNIETDTPQDILENNSDELLNFNDNLEISSDNQEEDILTLQDSTELNIAEDTNFLDNITSYEEAQPQETIIQYEQTEEPALELINDNENANEYITEESFADNTNSYFDEINSNAVSEEENNDANSNINDIDSSTNSDEKDATSQTEDLVFETNTIPSINEIETTEVNDNGLEALFDNDKSVFDETHDKQAETKAPQENKDLFESNQYNTTQQVNDNSVTQPQRKNSKFLPVAGTFIILLGLGYYSYTKFFNQEAPVADTSDVVQDEINTYQSEQIP